MGTKSRALTYATPISSASPVGTLLNPLSGGALDSLAQIASERAGQGRPLIFLRPLDGCLYQSAKHRAWVTLRRMDWIDIIQWPAMAVTVMAAWLIASQRKFKRNWAFWLFLLSNVLWMVWGWHDRAYALIFLQLCLGFLNIRGAMKNRAGG